MKVLAIIVLIIIFPLYFLAIFGLSFKFTVQNKNFIKNELKKQNAYTKLNRAIPEIVSIMQENKGDTGGAPVLSKEELAVFLQGTLTPDVLEEMVGGALSGNKSSAISKNGVPLNDGVKNILKAKFEKLPECPPGATSEEMTCRPAGMTFDQLMAQMSAGGDNPLFGGNILQQASSQDQQAEQPQTEQQQTEQPKKDSGFSILSTIGQLSNFAYIFPIILLVIIFFLARGYAGTWLGSGKVFGLFLAILSTLSLVVNMILSLFNKPLAGLISGFANGLPKLKNELIVPLINDIFGKVSQMTNVISISLIAFGAVLFILFLIIQKTRKPAQETVSAK